MNNEEIILVVEDHKGLCDLYRRICERNGFRMKEVRDIAEARMFLSGTIPSLVLLDLELPGANGLELLPWIRESVTLADLPVITVTGKPEMKEKALQAGASDHLEKPFSLYHLGKKISNWMGKPQP